MIKIKHLTKYYVKSKPVISDLNLEFKENGLNLIVGKSGCGKTTLLNMIGTIDQGYIGSIEFDGVELSTLSYNKISDFRNYYSAHVFQANSLFPHLSVKQNIQLVLNLQNKENNISEILKKVGLEGFENRKVKYLSGGEQQRVGIARAIAKDSKIILADEPTSALDSKNSHLIFSLLKEISKDKLVIIVTHDLKKAHQYADRVIRLVDGRVVEDEKINEPKLVNNDIVIKKPKKNLLLPIFWDKFRKGFVINLFIILLLTAVLTLTNVSLEQNKIVKDYDYYNEGLDVPFNKLKTLTTHYANNIDYYNVIPALEEDKPYTNFQEVSNRREGLSAEDIDIISDYFEDYNIYTYEHGNIIIEDISQVLLHNVEHNGIRYYWHEPQKSDFNYYLYNENNDYNLSHGRLPEAETEILITDTVADAYLLKNNLNNSDLSAMLNKELTVYDIYYQLGTYYYYVEKPFTVVGIIRTNQLNYYEYVSLSSRYEILDFFEQQRRDAPYMNSAFSQPHGYIVTMEHLDEYKNTRYYYENINVGRILYEDRTIKNNVGTFHGVDDYRGIFDYPDNLILDVNNRIIIKDTNSSELQGNEIIITTDLLRMIDPSINPWNIQQITDKFFNELSGTSISLRYTTATGIEEITYEIVGIARSNSTSDYYVSEEAYNQIYDLVNEIPNPSLVVGLESASPKKRIELIEKLYDLGYVLNPVNIVPPGAYLEFVETQGEIEIIDDEGFSEIVNISVYHLFSDYYNTEKMEEVNSVLEIMNSVYLFTLVVGLIISLGFIYLNERNQKSSIVRLTQLGVITKKIIIFNIFNYLLIAASIGFLTFFTTNYFINYINEIFMINAAGPYGVGLISRIRVLLTNTTLIISIISVIIIFIIGMITTISVTYKNRK